MDFRTSFDIEPSARKITYNDPVMMIGSCFAINMGAKLSEGKIPVMVNPSGTVYNPVSVSATLDAAIEGKLYSSDDLFNHNGTWLSFDHYTEFSSPVLEKTLAEINRMSEAAHHFLSSARFLFITFGSARVFRFIRSGRIVSNCHKIPAAEFNRELLTVDEITQLWGRKLDVLKTKFPDLKVVFSVSPVRHLKDGAHGNQVSKSTLILAVEKLLEHNSSPGYFPAYELLMDDLRDYRFYADDMLHPSEAAINYIWSAFASSFLTAETTELWKEISAISRGMSHRVRSGSAELTRQFAKNMSAKIEACRKKLPSVDFSSERNYFNSLL
jgi:hypothetical protein